MKRSQFLKLGLFPAAVVAAKAAKTIDPGNEAMREVDGQLIVNGSNVTVSNVVFRTPPARSALLLRGAHSTVRNSIFLADESETVGIHRQGESI